MHLKSCWQYEFYRFAEGEQVDGEVWIRNPIINLYIDDNIKLLYYPRFGKEIVPALQEYFFHNKSRISYVFLDTCDGGLLCRPNDFKCISERDNLINTLNSSFVQVYFREQGECQYFIFKNDF